MTCLRRTIWGHLLTLVLLATASVAGVSAADGPDNDLLRELRAARRESSRVRSLSADKNGPARFGLLVIPVDFADARLPREFQPQDLGERLFPDRGESLHNYFRIASGGGLDLSVTLAPLVSLPLDRRQYSDRDLNGFSRTRLLATAALTAVRDLGLDFRRLDLDGPDGVPGSGDDDGQVDGVLILHAGPGTENDPETGLIQALQFFLDEPVVSQGVAASFYAVASLASGPGIWAHETAHLLGLEDRYDPLLRPAGENELRSRGGLGRFSLMASGAWGTGHGYGAALPDAYSAAQMGWYRVRNLKPAARDSVAPALRSGEVARVWRQGTVGPEFFLLETRDPVSSAPFDAAVPGDQLLIYHVDENVLEGTWSDDGPNGWHLRAALVEADDTPGLAAGLDDGSAADLFPGLLGVTDFGPLTAPASSSYDGAASRVSLGGIGVQPGRVVFAVSLDTGPSLQFSAGFAQGTGTLPLSLTAHETGASLGSMTVAVSALSGADGGSFSSTGTTSVTFDLMETGPGEWTPAQPVTWQLPAGLPAGAHTVFQFSFSDGTTLFPAEARTWVWSASGQELDFRNVWPGGWTIAHPDGNLETTWHRWAGPPWLTANAAPVLACTDSSDTDSALWPNVGYKNGAYTTLTSAPLPADVAAVRMTHAIEVEVLNGTTGPDGGLVRWVGPDGQSVPAVPLEGYRGVISPLAFNPLQGQAAFVADSLSLDNLVPLWRTDTFLLPTDGVGPWRLSLVFGANSQWRARGWFVADLEAIPSGGSATALQVTWAKDLAWNWPWPSGATAFSLQVRPDDQSPWQTVLADEFSPDGQGLFHLAGSRVLPLLAGSERQRHQVRLLGQSLVGAVASPVVVIYRDGGDGDTARLGLPWPNPANGTVRFMVQLPPGDPARLRIFDVRGRLVLDRLLAAGQQLATWDGSDGRGQRVPAGPYFLRLEGSGPTLTRKVVLLH
jgi:immune inhibitor A